MTFEWNSGSLIDEAGWLARAFAVCGLKEFGETARKAMIIGEAAPEIRART